MHKYIETVWRVILMESGELVLHRLHDEQAPIAEMARRIEDEWKEIGKKIVVPFLGVGTILFYLSSWQSNMAHGIVLGLNLLLAGLNAWASNLTGNWRKTNIRPRADKVDAIRWLLNLVVFDVVLMLVLRPDSSVFIPIWTMLLIGVQLDLFRQHYRVVVGVVGWLTGSVLLWWLYFNALTISQIALASMSMIGIFFVFEQISSVWVRELKQRINAQYSAVFHEQEAKKMLYNAQLGAQAQMIAHELSNLVQVIALSNGGRQANVDRIDRSIQLIQTLNGLVLSGVAKNQEPKPIEISTLIQDIQMLTAKLVSGKASLEIEIEESCRNRTINERPGSLFFMIVNLIKNGSEAMASGAETDGEVPKIQLLVSSEGQDYVRISVVDRGQGLSPEQIQAILASRADSTRADGHGLGTRFVVEQAALNQFRIEIDSVLGQGTRFSLICPSVLTSL